MRPFTPLYSCAIPPLLLQDTHLVGKKRADVVEELQLLLQRVAALLRHVHHVEDGRPQVSQSRDGLHLDGVPLLQGVVQDAGGVHHLQKDSEWRSCQKQTAWWKLAKSVGSLTEH